ncbi:MAG: MoaD/ThiS family protein [Candidatus Thorarchaeota archaeon]
MIVKFRFRGPLATRMPSEVYEIELEDSGNLKMALELLITSHDEVKEHWQSSEQMDRETLLLRNEVDIGLLEGLGTILEDGDMLVILPLVHGG